MSRTPGFIDPSAYSSPEMVTKKLQEQNKEFGFTPLGDELLHSSDVVHYGVKGMHWGQRKAKNDAPNPRYSERRRGEDKKVYGKRGVKRINRRMNEGQKLFKAQQREAWRKVGTGTAIAIGLKAATMVIANRDVLAQSVAKRAETKRGQAAAANIMGLPRKPTNGPTYAKKNRQGVHNISSF